MSENVSSQSKEGDSSSLHILSLSLLVGFVLLAGSIWFSAGSLITSISDLDSTLLNKEGLVSTNTIGTVPSDDTQPAPTPAPSQPIEELLDGRPHLGSENPEVLILGFSDFACGYCGRVLPTIDKIIQNYPQVKFVPLQFPIFTPKAAEASECAADQDMFWDYYYSLYELNDHSIDDLKTLATEVGLDRGEFDSCLDSSKKADLVATHMEFGRQNGVKGTPGFLINGKLFTGAQPYENFQQVLDAELAS